MSMAGFEAKYVRFGAAVAVIVLAIGYLAYTGVQESKSYYVTIGELKSMGEPAFSKKLRVSGEVKPGTIERRGTHLQFALWETTTADGRQAAKAGDPGAKTSLLNVEYSGMDAPPDTFKDDAQAMVEGNYGRDGVFHAQQIQAKCASKYAPAQGAKPAGQSTASAASPVPVTAAQAR